MEKERISKDDVVIWSGDRTKYAVTDTIFDNSTGEMLYHLGGKVFYVPRSELTKVTTTDKQEESTTDKQDELSFDDYLVSLIMMLDTPLWRKRMGIDSDEMLCVRNIRKELVKRGLIEEQEYDIFTP